MSGKNKKKTDGKKVFHFLEVSFPNRFLFFFFVPSSLKERGNLSTTSFPGTVKRVVWHHLPPYTNTNLRMPSETLFSFFFLTFLGK